MSCPIVKKHSPIPLRYVKHHILPQACGGRTVVANLVTLCDTCHYAIHHLMYCLARSLPLPASHSKEHLVYAVRGYEEALALGTAHLMPDEG
jgi:5-methylcytosine-specific restriction endonuclease McrA